MNDSIQLAELLEEIFQRVEAGESVDVGQYVVKYPELSSQIQQLVPAMTLLGDFSQFSGETPSAAQSTAAISHNPLGDYRLVRQIGQGGMGVVYEAEQMSLSRRVAVKILPFASLWPQSALERFAGEVRIAASLEHRHVVTIYGVGCERGVHFYSMKLIDGCSLADVIRRRESLARIPQASAEVNRQLDAATTESIEPRPSTAISQTTPNAGLGSSAAHTANSQPPNTDDAFVDAIVTEVVGNDSWYRAAARLGQAAAQALAFAHERGVIHRDIKPSNLLLDRAGKLFVTDFGLARCETDISLTRTGELLGTPRYMSPEQASGSAQSPGSSQQVHLRTDIYSLGATLYELLTGRPAIGASGRAAALRELRDLHVVPLRTHDPDIPRPIELIVLQCLQSDPRDRYRTAAELSDDLGRYLEGSPVAARPIGFVRRASRWAKRHPRAKRGLIAALSICVTLSVLIAWITQHPGYFSPTPRGPPEGQIVDSSTSTTSLLDLNPSPESSDMLRSTRNRTTPQNTQSARRRLLVESLEDRRLLAVVAADGFESANFAGGTEQWAVGNWNSSGDAAIRSDTSPASGSQHARLRRSTGDLQRTVDVTGLTDVRLQFSAKLISFEGSDRADVKVSGDGTNWTTIQSFFNGDDDGQYHTYDLAVPDVGDTLHIRFDAGMSGSGDYWYIDDVQITGTSGVEQRGSFIPLGFLPGKSASTSRAISADGQYVVGGSEGEAFLWSHDGGLIALGEFSADDVSHDGTVVVGGDGSSNAYRWENGILTVVGDLTTIGRTEDDPGGTRMSSIHRVSADGSVMVGNTAVDFKGESDSFRIVGGEIQPIGDLPGGARNSGARAVSADGSIVVGAGNSANGREAYRWENGIFTPLGDLPGGTFDSLAWTVSENGQFVVGQSESAAGIEAYLWSNEKGMVGLGHLPGETTDSRVRGVSGDGSIVVGTANHGQAVELLDAFIWDEHHGMRSLQDVLISEYGLGDALSGWTLSRAMAISEDGRIITGVGINPSGLREAYVVELEDIYPNIPPTVDAEPDVTINDADATGSEAVTLVGTAIDSDGTIVSVEWAEGSTVLGNEATLNSTLAVGTHTLTFTAVDNEGASSSDSVIVTTLANQGPTANAGADQTVSDSDSSGSEMVTLIGSGNDVDGTITTYQWTEGNTVLGTSSTISPVLTVGTHVLTLTVTDNGGATASDSVVVTVEQPSNATALYVYDIRFDDRKHGRDWRAVFTIKSDSNANGVGDFSDAAASGVSITVVFAGQTYSGTTDSGGIFRTGWIKNLSSGDHYANAVDLALSGYSWNPFDIDGEEDDSDGDGLPDAVLSL